MRLTDKTLAALKSKPKLYKVTDDRCPGLTLRVHPGGTMAWYIRKVVQLDGAKQRVELKIGNFPDMNCTQARAEFHQQTAVIDDALSHAVSAARSRVTGLTLLKLAEMYLAYIRPSVRTKTHGNYTAIISDSRRVARGVDPIQDMLCSRLTRSVVEKWLQSILAPGYKKNYIDNIAALYSSAVQWGIDKGHVNVANHFASLKRQDLKRVRAAPKRRRTLSDIELQFVWDFYAFGSNPARSFETQTILRLLVLTGLRRAEVINMRWEEIAAVSQVVPGLNETFDLIVIPEERTKTGVTPYCVPMIGPIRKVLDQYAARVPLNKRTGLMFPFSAAKINGILSALHRRGVTHTIHDIRRTFATRTSAAGMSREWVDAVLNHTTGGNSSDFYIHHEFIGQKVVAMEAWFELLAPILARPPVLVLPAPVEKLVA